MASDYCSPDQVAAQVGITDTSDDALIALAVSAASRQIDGETGRFFYQDATVQTRTYTAEGPDTLDIDDVSTVTGLIVQFDNDGTGTFEQTLTIDSDFIVGPVNAARMNPVRPYEHLQMVNGFYLPRSYYGRPGIQVTAKFGWPAVPDDVIAATIIQATQLYKAKDAVFGAIALGDTGAAMRVRSGLNPIAAALVEPFARPRVG